MRRFQSFRLDSANQCLWHEEARVALTPKAFGVLRYLVEHAGRLVTQEELLEALWPATYINPEVLRKYVLEIRRALGDRPDKPVFIETRPKRGYEFVASVIDEGAAGMLFPAGTKRLVGRESALAELGGYLIRAQRDERQVIFITGEPGIGKTALVDEFQRRARINATGLSIARGQCVEGYGGKEPYYPMLEAVGQLCRGSEGGSVVQILATQAPTWLVQFPAFLRREQREMLQREILGATRERMLREISEALETIASQRPLLLVLEDLQWVDPSTIDLISALARRRESAKLMLIGTYRPVDVVLYDHPLKALKQDLLIHHLCHEIAVQPLEEPEVAEYLASECECTAVPEGLSGLIHRYTEGNPLFMVAVLEHMRERQLITQENGKFTLTLSLQEMELHAPESLRQMIEIQIERLSEEEHRVLEVASVTGALFSPAVSATAARMDAENFEKLCEGLSRRQQIVRSADSQEFPEGTTSARYEFVHALYREVLYNRQSPGSRKKIHLHVGARLEVLYAQRRSEAAPELAHHFEQGGDCLRAVKYLQLASNTAGQRFEPRQAADILEHAVTLAKKLPDTESAKYEITILEKLATIYLSSGDSRAIPTSESLVSSAAQRGLVEVGVDALLKMTWQLLWTDSEQCLKALERALQLNADCKDPLLHARTVTRCSVCTAFARGWDAKYVEECRDALNIIRKRGNRLMLGSSLTDYSYIQWLSSEYRAAFQSATEGLAATIQESQNNPYLNDAFLRYMIVPWSLLFLGKWGQARHEFDQTIAIMERNADYHQALAYKIYGAWLNVLTMDFAGVLEICDSIIPLLRDVDGYRIDARFGSVLMACAELGLANFEGAHGLLSATQHDMEILPMTADWYWRTLIESALTELWLAKGELVRARLHAENSVKLALTTDERTLQALALEANARVALAEEDFDCVQDSLAMALKAMEGFQVPLAQWRVDAAAAELHQRLGNKDLANNHRELSRDTIMRLANSLPTEDPLRHTFLSAPMIRKILGDAETPWLRAKGA